MATQRQVGSLLDQVSIEAGAAPGTERFKGLKSQEMKVQEVGNLSAKQQSFENGSSVNHH